MLYGDGVHEKVDGMDETSNSIVALGQCWMAVVEFLDYFPGFKPAVPMTFSHLPS
jgi:hypothetical protein